MSINKDIEKLCEEINKSDLSDSIKKEAIALLKYTIVKEHQIRDYNKGCRPDSLN